MASPSPPASPQERHATGCGMVEMELGAARALAHLAGLAAGSEGDGSRSRERSTSESPFRAQQKSFHGSQESSALGDTCSTAGCEGGHTATGNGAEDTAHIEFPSNQPSLPGRRCKQNLTEAEKEERRLRRVLANRESARQTIRRRQALREELTRKVASLSLENENMRMQKDVAMKEYLSLKDTNEHLKEQIAMQVRSGAESSETAAAKEMESSTCSPGFSMHKPLTSADTIGFFKHSGSVQCLYMPPCAWYYPSHHKVSHSFGDQDAAASGDNEARVSVHGRDDKDQSLIARAGNEKEDALVSKRTHKDEKMVKMLPSTSKEKSELQRDKGLPEKLQARSPGESSSTSSAAAAAAAAEARKRRKQLTKLKHNHGSWAGKHG
ncbi:bZIP transcription factor [Musa troglodytarum]|uniref:BZIP transcription factor n=1 Tax=Musa troglodytarum TaxID=320322 RepID=A0A9E7G2M9_9LILI|nr:bZIP transcription factor [Musa troglodytarum]